MKEKALNFRINDDPTPVVLSEKQKKALEKSTNDLRFAVVHLNKEAAEGRLETGMKETLCSLIESHAQSVTHTLGYEGVLLKEKDERFKEIRDLNTENRALRKQLGEKVSNVDVREAIKNMIERFKSWWNIIGFGHSSDEYCAGYAFKAKLSGMMTDSYYDKSENADTEETKADKLRQLGFDISDGESRTDRKIIFSESNMLALARLLQSKYPSCEILDSRAWHGNKEKPEIREVNIIIRNYDEI